MRNHGFWVAACVVAMGALPLVGCGRPPAPRGLTIPRGDAPTGWPQVLITTSGRAPALFAGPDEQAPAFGHLGPGVRVRIEGPVQGQRVPVTVGGSMVVHAWAQVNRLASTASQRGRVEGTPTYVGIGDPVSLLGQNDDGSWRVVVRPRLGRPEVDDGLVGYSASLPANWVSAEPDDVADTGLNAGEPRLTPAGQELVLYDRPDGAVVARIPPLDPPLTVVVLRERDGWSGVRVGVGPFLVGYLRGELAPSTIDAIGVKPVRPASEGIPSRVASETGNLFRVAAGTHVSFYGEDVATLRREAYARELSPRQGEEADVYVAVDDGVAIRGVVPVSALTPRLGTVMPDPVLGTKRLTLRVANAHEAQHIIAYYARNETHLRPWEPERPDSFLTLPYWTERIGMYADQSFAGTSYRFFLFTKSREVARDTGAIVGSVSLTQIERGPFMCGRLGFSIDAACEGQGLMREAVSAVVEFGFGEVGLHRIEANHQPQNLRSAALLRGLDFDVQGYARDYLFLNGAWRDHVLTARTAK